MSCTLSCSIEINRYLCDLKITLYSVVSPFIENVNSEYEFDVSELLADHDVTGVDLIWTSSTYNSCRFVWAGNGISMNLTFIHVLPTNDVKNHFWPPFHCKLYYCTATGSYSKYIVCACIIKVLFYTCTYIQYIYINFQWPWILL